MTGGIVHFILGRLQPKGYAVFADTALLPWLSQLWASFVMPNIGLLTVVLGIYQITCGIGIIWKRTVVVATWGMIVFLVFITIVGYGFPSASLGEDLLKNRWITALMVALLVPLLTAKRRTFESGMRSQRKHRELGDTRD
ncbi:hypothetical protein [Nesterenkonia muleiensis]|uniref:hypothetical protein n=1 Tax=Nesterenkonia muleiensis TaxID=2282648 RepID=UPI00192E5710|nr:hypothetical protein [Nesterenkonia muleiensis]